MHKILPSVATHIRRSMPFQTEMFSHSYVRNSRSISIPRTHTLEAYQVHWYHSSYTTVGACPYILQQGHLPHYSTFVLGVSYGHYYIVVVILSLFQTPITPGSRAGLHVQLAESNVPGAPSPAIVYAYPQGGYMMALPQGLVQTPRSTRSLALPPGLVQTPRSTRSQVWTPSSCSSSFRLYWHNWDTGPLRLHLRCEHVHDGLHGAGTFKWHFPTLMFVTLFLSGSRGKLLLKSQPRATTQERLAFLFREKAGYSANKIICIHQNRKN